MTDKEIFDIMRPYIDWIDGGYACDMMPEKIVEAGRAVIKAKLLDLMSRSEEDE